MKIFNYPFKDLFETGAARSLPHINLFHKIVSGKINCSVSDAMSLQQIFCSKSMSTDFDFFDINNKPLLTKGVITPYGKISFKIIKKFMRKD
jgi:hypothetical protein